MITGQASIRQARADLASAQAAIRQGAQDGVSAILDDLLNKMPTSTPVISGRMKAGYDTSTNGLSGELLDEAPYAEYVARTGTRFMNPNAALLGILTDAEDEAGAMLDAMIAARLAAL